MLTLNFYSKNDKAPEIGQKIVYVQKYECYGFVGLSEVTEDEVKGVWIEYEDGRETGTVVNYDPNDSDPPVPVPGWHHGEVTYQLRLMVDDQWLDEDIFWMTSDQYWEATFCAFDNRSHVKIPESAEEAELMIRVGMKWFNDNAPQRLSALFLDGRQRDE